MFQEQVKQNLLLEKILVRKYFSRLAIIQVEKPTILQTVIHQLLGSYQAAKVGMAYKDVKEDDDDALTL